MPSIISRLHTGLQMAVRIFHTFSCFQSSKEFLIVRNFLIPVSFQWLLNRHKGLFFTSSIHFPAFQMKRKIQAHYYAGNQARQYSIFVRTMQNISGHLTCDIRKRNGDIKHNSAKVADNVLISKQWETNINQSKLKFISSP